MHLCGLNLGKPCVLLLDLHLAHCLDRASTATLLPWGYPWQTAADISSTVARQVGGACLDLYSSKMVSFPASMTFEAGLTFTVGAFTWTTSTATTVGTMAVVRPAPHQHHRPPRRQVY